MYSIIIMLFNSNYVLYPFVIDTANVLRRRFESQDVSSAKSNTLKLIKK